MNVERNAVGPQCAALLVYTLRTHLIRGGQLCISAAINASQQLICSLCGILHGFSLMASFLQEEFTMSLDCEECVIQDCL